jgi:hypothetical protein
MKGKKRQVSYNDLVSVILESKILLGVKKKIVYPAIWMDYTEKITALLIGY